MVRSGIQDSSIRNYRIKAGRNPTSLLRSVRVFLTLRPKGPRRCYCCNCRRATPESGISGLFPAGGFEPSTFLSKNGLPRRVRRLLAARERCCFPTLHRGGNSPLLPLYRPGSRDRRASDDLGRERDGTPQTARENPETTRGGGQKGPRLRHARNSRRATPGAPRCSASRWNPQDWSCPRDTGRAVSAGQAP